MHVTPPRPSPTSGRTPSAELALEPGVTRSSGPTAQGKTNLVEAVGYVATLVSHRVATDAPLVRLGAERAVVRAAVVHDGREPTRRARDRPGPGQPGRVNRVAGGPPP